MDVRMCKALRTRQLYKMACLACKTSLGNLNLRVSTMPIQTILRACRHWRLDRHESRIPIFVIQQSQQHANIMALGFIDTDPFEGRYSKGCCFRFDDDNDSANKE